MAFGPYYELDRIHRGSIDVGVPLLDDVIQIAAGEVNGKARLHIEKTKSDLTVVRQDKQLIQVAVREHTKISEYPWEEVKVSNTFVDPVASLAFERSKKSKRWYFEDESSIDDEQALWKLTTVLAGFVPLKQEGQYRRLRAAKTIKGFIFGPPEPRKIGY